MTGLASLIMKMDRKLDQQLGVMREESLHAKGEMEVRFQSMQLAVEQQQSTQLEHFDTVLDGTKEALLDRCETAEKTCTDAARLSKQACEGYIDEYYRQFNLKCTVLRFGSLYGLRSDEHNAIYRFIKFAKLFKSNTKVVVNIRVFWINFYCLLIAIN